jgi:hypothetical protein
MDIQIISNYYFWYTLFAAVGIAVGIISYRRSFPPLTDFQRILLSALRALMIILLGIFLVDPLLNLYSTETINPRLAVLIDTSRSMSVKDGSVSRISLAGSAVQPALNGIDVKYDLYSFSSGLSRSSAIPSENETVGDATSIANALQDLGKLSESENYGAVLLVTDGRQNLGDDPLEAATRLNIPIHTLTVGQQVTEKNLAIDNIKYPAVAYSGVNFRVEAEISASGLERGKSRLALKLKGANVADISFDIPEENRKVQAALDVTAPEPGNHEYLLSAPLFEGEAVKVDNERLFAVRVLKNKLNILLISSALDWEFKFARQALSLFEEFEVAAVYPGTDGRYSDPGMPQGADGLKKYDVIFIINSSPAELRISTSDLKKYVTEGGSLIYLAGADAARDIVLFEGILPIRPVNARVSNSEYFFEPSPTRKQHAAILMNEDPDINARIWHSLPPFTSLLGKIDPTGEVLLEAGLSARDSLALRGPENTGDINPLLTVGRFGNGKVAAITGFPWWRSYFGSAKNERLTSALPEFWRNLVKWSSATEEMQNFRVITDRRVYRLGESVTFTGYLYDETNRPRNGALVSVAISQKSDPTIVKDVVLTQTDNGIYSEVVSSLSPGHYQFDAVASSYGDSLGKTSGEFTIEAVSLEMASNSPDYNLTRRLADGTGGKPYTIDNFGNLAQDLKIEPYSQESHASVRPFGLPVLLVLLIVGLCVEWGLRKRLRLP